MKTNLQILLISFFVKVLLFSYSQAFGFETSCLTLSENTRIDSINQYIGGNTEAEYNYIYWQNIPSKNFKFYLLQRSVSFNGNFTTIARIYASSNQFMGFKDYYPKTTSYYRLLAFDSIGDFTIYNILSLERSAKKNQSFNFIATQDAHIFYIAYKSDTEEPINLEIYKEGINPIYQNTLSMTKGNNLIKLDLHFLPEGLYSVELRQNNIIYQQQFAMLSGN